jgi:hypothetical protein
MTDGKCSIYESSKIHIADLGGDENVLNEISLEEVGGSMTIDASDGARFPFILDRQMAIEIADWIYKHFRQDSP